MVDQDYHRQLLQATAELKSEVNLLGEVSMDALSRWYQAADVFLLPGSSRPNKWEGFGMVYIEAGSFGLPSIATRWAGIPEAVPDRKCGLLSEPGDPAGLAGNLKLLLCDRQVRANYGKAAAEHARSFSWERTAKVLFAPST